MIKPRKITKRSVKRKNPNRYDIEEKLAELLNDTVIIYFKSELFSFSVKGILIDGGIFRWKVVTSDRSTEAIFNLFSIKSIEGNKIILEQKVK